MLDGKKAQELLSSSGPDSSYKEISDGERCEMIALNLISNVLIRVSREDEPANVARFIADVAEELNGEIIRRGWTA